MNTNYEKVIANYRELLLKHKEGPEVAQISREGQIYRFKKLLEIGDIEGKSMLDIGCGLGDLAEYLKDTHKEFTYTGVDIVPELINAAKTRHKTHNFYCIDLLEERLPENFDYVLISGVFNNSEIKYPKIFMEELLVEAFKLCKVGIAFNFISTVHNFMDEKMNYYSPEDVLKFCTAKLSPHTNLYHHYERCDVAVFIYKK